MILLVEDEAITRNAFADALRMEGHQVVQAADGVQALSIFDKCHVDLVITDLVMPRLNGFELIDQIRSKRPPRTNPPHFRVHLAEGRRNYFKWKR
jgi:two-component system OmpR family response regulator